VPFVIRPAQIPELARPGEAWEAAVVRLAREKALAVARGGQWTLGADTVVLIDGRGLGKPVDRQQGAQMLGQLAGRAHRVVTGYALLGPAGLGVEARAVSSEVLFRPFFPGELEAYLDSGEPFGKAGGYAIQGIGAALVREVRGSYTNVVGLPLPEVLEALQQAGALAGPTLAAGRPALEDAS